MSNLIESSLDIETLDKEKLEALPTAELKILLAKAVSVTAQMIDFLANVWRVLEDRGEDLSEMRTGILRYLPLISSGKTASSIVLKFAGQQVLLREIALLPTAEQGRLANGEKVPLVTELHDGSFKTDLVDISSIHVRHYRQLFNLGELRTENEQKAWLNEQKKLQRKKKTQQKVRKKTVHFDQEKMAIKCGATSILLEDIFIPLAKVSGKSESEIANLFRTFLNIDIDKE